MTQRWKWLTFLHWGYPPETIGKMLPKGLEIDTFDGLAWVGLAPFLLSDIRWRTAISRSTRSPKWLSTFPETNVRTYVKGPDGGSGVWFFTLEADRLLGVLGARWLYHLPYRWADMDIERTGNRVRYRSRRRWPFGEGTTDIVVEPGNPLQLGDFDHFLTARFRLYAAYRDRLAYAEIEHEPWPLVSAKVLKLEHNLIEKSGIPRESGAPVVHYSEDLNVRVDKMRWLDV